MNRDLTIVQGGETRQRRIEDRAELQRLLTDAFGIDCDVSRLRVPTIPEWD
jgi:arylamine N-acetyltransferase